MNALGCTSVVCTCFARGGFRVLFSALGLLEANGRSQDSCHTAAVAQLARLSSQDARRPPCPPCLRVLQRPKLPWFRAQDDGNPFVTL